MVKIAKDAPRKKKHSIPLAIKSKILSWQVTQPPLQCKRGGGGLSPCTTGLRQAIRQKEAISRAKLYNGYHFRPVHRREEYHDTHGKDTQQSDTISRAKLFSGSNLVMRYEPNQHGTEKASGVTGRVHDAHDDRRVSRRYI